MQQTNQIQTFELSGNHHDYQINISVPDNEPPEAGYPVLYILDGNAYFRMFHEISRLQMRRPEKTGIQPMVLVGIGYKGENVFDPSRVYDFTPPAESVILPDKPDGSPWAEHGGASAFLHILQGKIKPAVMKNYLIDDSKETVFTILLAVYLYCIVYLNSQIFFELFCLQSIHLVESASNIAA